MLSLSPLGISLQEGVIVNRDQLRLEWLLLVSYFTADEIESLTWEELRFLAALEDEELPEAVPDDTTARAVRAYGGRVIQKITEPVVWDREQHIFVLQATDERDSSTPSAPQNDDQEWPAIDQY